MRTAMHRSQPPRWTAAAAGWIALLWVLSCDGVHGVLHCLVVQQLCQQDNKCVVLLDVIDKACGDTFDGTVCRSLSLDTCKGALHTLLSHQLFQGECVCSEDSFDRDCREFRDSITRHPCLKVPRVDTGVMTGFEEYPTCNYAFTLCHNNVKCKKIFDSFRRACKIQGDECDMPDRAKCRRALSKIQLTPIYGCLCHDDRDTEKCIRIYKLVNKNPCVETIISRQPKPPPPPPMNITDWIELAMISSSSTDYPEDAASDAASSSMLPSSSTEGEGGVTPLVDDNSIPGHVRYPTGNIAVHILEGGGNVPPESQLTTPVVTPIHGEPVGLHELKSPSNVIQPFQSRGDGREPRVTGPPPDRLPSTAIKAMSTCQKAYYMCEIDTACNVLLGNMMQVCETNGAPCNRTECMMSVKDFYHLGNPSKTYPVAFCICRQDDNECLVHQRKLHPPCSQGAELEMPGCHEVADQCRASNDCRKRMDHFVEACAVDSHTFRCKGPLMECRKALVGILGTPLRTNCACSGNDFALLYYCIDWQRLVWLNPCVVQAQKDFHEARATTIHPPAPPSPTKNPNTFIPITRVPRNTTTTTTTATTARATTTSHSTSTSTITHTTTLFTTTESEPEPGCVLVGTENITFRLNTGQRIYDPNDCSSVCMCDLNGALKCEVIGCPPKKPCFSPQAVWVPMGRTYKAEQGPCRCYSEYFLCAKPKPNSYELGVGVYLFIAYSKEEEDLMKPMTSLDIRNLLIFLQRTFDKGSGNKSQCRFTVTFHQEENIIIQVYLEDFALDHQNNTITDDMILKEEEVCAPPLRNLSNLIMDNDPVVRQDILLSLLKVAYVDHFIQPYSGDATAFSRFAGQRFDMLMLFLLGLLLALNPPP